MLVATKEVATLFAGIVVNTTDRHYYHIDATALNMKSGIRLASIICPNLYFARVY